MFALTLPKWLANLCSAIRATLGQRQIRQSPGLAQNAHSGNDWGPIPVLTGRGLRNVATSTARESTRNGRENVTSPFKVCFKNT